MSDHVELLGRDAVQNDTFEIHPIVLEHCMVYSKLVKRYPEAPRRHHDDIEANRLRNLSIVQTHDRTDANVTRALGNQVLGLLVDSVEGFDRSLSQFMALNLPIEHHTSEVWRKRDGRSISVLSDELRPDVLENIYIPVHLQHLAIALNRHSLLPDRLLVPNLDSLPQQCRNQPKRHRCFPVMLPCCRHKDAPLLVLTHRRA
mmetsp:Transcript_1120/g.2629  ORF Transcript_1120/g.2629 Transcript_1120/m.2629 type:complete len:202 (-) Transcript_1120:59-664(-)